jgi:hypothetical protein
MNRASSSIPIAQAWSGMANAWIDYARRPDSEIEVCAPVHELTGFARGEGPWHRMPPADRREQLAHMADRLDDLYPAYRWFLFDGRERFSAPYTVFGPKRAVIYAGEIYLVFTSTELIREFTSHFDNLIRNAKVQPQRVRRPGALAHRRGGMIASLPMYDWPEVREATDAWWAGLARHLRAQGFEAPDRLTRSGDPSAQWRRPDLLVSQTCGYPLMHDFKGSLEVLATPVYDVEGCSGPSYSSVIVVAGRWRRLAARGPQGRHGGLQRRRFAVGASGAQMRLRSAQQGRAVLRPAREVGEPSRLDAGWCTSAKADVAAIDCVSYALARRHRPELAAGLAVIARGPAAPALPYVTAAGRPAGEIARLKQRPVRRRRRPRAGGAREALFIAGLEFLPPDAYHRVLDLEAELRRAGLRRPRLTRQQTPDTA